jgi:hypothetical protein
MERIVESLRVHQPMTILEICEYVHWCYSLQVIRRATSELEERGIVEKSFATGKLRHSLTKLGQTCPLNNLTELPRQFKCRVIKES